MDSTLSQQIDRPEYSEDMNTVTESAYEAACKVRIGQYGLATKVKRREKCTVHVLHYTCTCTCI